MTFASPHVKNPQKPQPAGWTLGMFCINEENPKTKGFQGTHNTPQNKPAS